MLKSKRVSYSVFALLVSKMATLRTVKALFARSGNRCAFPGCSTPLVLESDTVAGEVCHIKAQKAGGPRYDPHQTERQRSDAANLILLCANHHKQVDSDPVAYPAERLYAMKRESELPITPEITAGLEYRARLFCQNYIVHAKGDVNVSSIHAQNVTIQMEKNRRATITPPDHVIAASACHRNYLKYLIDRYQEFARAQPNREFRYAVVYESIKREFKATWDWIPLSRFVEVISFMQDRIDNTWLGRQKKKQGIARYDDFDSFRLTHC